MNIQSIVLTIGLVSSSLPAGAEDMLLFTNQVDGVIVITDEVCKKQGFVTKSTDARGTVLLWGCAMSVAGSLWKVRWNNGSEAYTNISDWYATDAFTARVKKAGK